VAGGSRSWMPLNRPGDRFMILDNFVDGILMGLNFSNREVESGVDRNNGGDSGDGGTTVDGGEDAETTSRELGGMSGGSGKGQVQLNTFLVYFGEGMHIMVADAQGGIRICGGMPKVCWEGLRDQVEIEARAAKAKL